MRPCDVQMHEPRMGRRRANEAVGNGEGRQRLSRGALLQAHDGRAVPEDLQLHSKNVVGAAPRCTLRRRLRRDPLRAIPLGDVPRQHGERLEDARPRRNLAWILIWV